MKNRAKDVLKAINEHSLEICEKEFSKADQDSGYAKYMASWFAEIPDSMSDEDARVYLGIQNPAVLIYF